MELVILKLANILAAHIGVSALSLLAFLESP